MREGAGLAAGQHDTGADLLLVTVELLPDGRGTADEGEAALFYLVPGLHLAEEVLAVLQHPQGRLRRRVPRRQQSDVLQQFLDEVPEVRLKFFARLLVRLGHVDWHAPAHLLRRGGVAGPVTGLPKLPEDALEDVDVEVGDAHVAVAPPGDEVDRLAAAGAGDPDGRVRLLQRPGPGVDVPE